MGMVHLLKMDLCLWKNLRQKPRAGSSRQNQKNKKVEKQTFGPEEEKNLAPKPVALEAAEGNVDSSYAAGDFQNLYKKFLQDAKASGMTHKDAREAWMCSTERAEALSGLSRSEMKKRRFV